MKIIGRDLINLGTLGSNNNGLFLNLIEYYLVDLTHVVMLGFSVN